VSVTRNPKLRTACDRCYELKERCERATPSAHCARCERLGLACLTVRPVRPVGRRTQHGKDFVSRITSGKRRKLEQCQLSIDACLDALPDLKPEEKELLLFLLSQPNSLDQFVVCSSFQAEQQYSLATQLPAAPPLLKDAYLACAITLKQLQSGSVTDMDTRTCVGYISKAMTALRSLPVLRSQDTVLCHTLGSVLAFSIYSAIGVGVPEICRYCLGTTNPFVGTAVFDAHSDPWESFLVLLETMDCLVHRRKPTRTIQIPAFIIDRRLGLCLPLLPYYHDLCVISNSLLDTTDVSILARLQKQLDGIHAVVESWQPSHSDQLIEQFDSADIVNLLAQAKVYRLGALLVGHRLRFPFGCEDVQAEIWSKEAMMEFELAKRVTKRSLRFVTLPFIVAAVEVQDESLRFKTLQSVDDYVDDYAPFMRKATKTFLSRVWHERDLNLTSRWFDSIHKPCPVMDSIDANCFGSS
jgi:Fungal Zn(2)-Cys(6) binuclear cluster domain